MLYLNNSLSAAFAFLIQGAFELDGVLLHARDGLALWHHDVLEMEALSNDAIIELIVSDKC